MAGEARLTQTQIAALLKTTPSRVGQWFQGRNKPRGDIAEHLAAVLGVHTDWMLHGIESDISISSGPTTSLEEQAVITSESLRRSRESLGLTQQEFADRLGVTIDYMQKAERGDIVPPLHFAASVRKLIYGSSSSVRKYGSGGGQTSNGPINSEEKAFRRAARIEADIKRFIDSLLAEADGDPERLGWIRVQLKAHLSPPPYWADKRADSLIERHLDEIAKKATGEGIEDHQSERSHSKSG